MIERIKRANDELKADRPTADEINFIPKAPIYILLEDIRSVHNVGSIFRTADGFGVSQIYLAGYTACPPRDDLTKTALGADKVVPWLHFEDSLEAVNDLDKKGITSVAIEQTINSASIYDIVFDFPICLILGNEVGGVSEKLLDRVKFHAEIPMKGIKQSLNVSVAAGIAGFELLRQYAVR
jgi:tRNA G18 (ribose-2'-O)-methylase SpoU